MATRSEASLASILLTSRSGEDDAAPLSAGEYWRLVDRVGDPGSLLGLDATGVRDALGSPVSEAERVSRLLDRGTALAFLMESLEQQGMHVLSPFDEDYPKRLRDRLRSSAPPLLYAVGALPILELPALGIVGSRDPAPGAARAAIEAAEAAVAHGRAVVSGGAKGIDQLALAAAFSAGGSAIGVLADSLERRLRDPDTRRAIGDERVCLVTPFKPTAGFSVANAMSRNKLIYAMSDFTFVASAALETGGTWAGAAEALHRGYAPVAVWVGSGAAPGNEPLSRIGARAVADLSTLFDEGPDGQEPGTSAEAEQMGLGI